MIPAPTEADLARDAERDLNGIAMYPDVLSPWIRRAVAAEAERDNFERKLDDINHAAHQALEALGKPMPKGANWLEAAWELPRALAALHAERDQARRLLESQDKAFMQAVDGLDERGRLAARVQALEAAAEEAIAAFGLTRCYCERLRATPGFICTRCKGREALRSALLRKEPSCP